MHTIRTIRKFREWAQASILARPPMQEVPIGYGAVFEMMLVEIEVAERGGLFLGSDKGTWSEYFDEVFQKLRMSSEIASLSARASAFTVKIDPRDSGS